MPGDTLFSSMTITDGQLSIEACDTADLPATFGAPVIIVSEAWPGKSRSVFRAAFSLFRPERLCSIQ